MKELMAGCLPVDEDDATIFSGRKGESEPGTETALYVDNSSESLIFGCIHSAGQIGLRCTEYLRPVGGKP